MITPSKSTGFTLASCASSDVENINRVINTINVIFFPCIDSFNLIIEGKIGIFYPDLAKLKLITEPLTRIVYINEHEAEQRRLKNFHK